MGIYAQPLLLALGALVFGAAGSAWIARHRRGIRAAASYLLLTVVPYVGIMAIIAASTDPTLSRQQAQYNGEFAFALFVMAFTVPWIVACLVGAWLGRRGRTASATPPDRAVPSGAQSVNLPDWTRADNPRLTLAQLDAKIRAMAECYGFDAQRLPECGSPSEGEGAFIDVEKFDYVYGYYERGQLSSTHPSAVANEICYRVLYDLAFADAMNLRSKNPDPALPFLVQVHRELDAILRRIDPRWAAQAVHERTLRAAANA